MQIVDYVGWKLHLARGMLRNVVSHTTVWEEEETVLLVLMNLNISYWCNEVLTERGLLFIPGNKHCCRIQSQQKGKGELTAPVLSHGIKYQVESDANQPFIILLVFHASSLE